MVLTRNARISCGLFALVFAGCGTQTSRLQAIDDRVKGEDEKLVQVLSDWNSSRLVDEDSFNIINGKAPEAKVTQSTVAVMQGGSLCSGTIIGPRHILTAAHCFKTNSPNGNIIFGTKVQGGTTLRKIQKIATHFGFNPAGASISDDIALVTFEGSLPEGFKAAQLPSGSQQIEKSSTVIIAGFGRSSRANSTAAGVLLQGESTVVTGAARPKYIQLAGKNDTYLCFGDSGGPTYLPGDKLTVIGVTSHGRSSACDSDAFVTDVRQYLEWLSQMGDADLRAVITGSAVKQETPLPVQAPTPAPVPTQKPPMPADDMTATPQPALPAPEKPGQTSKMQPDQSGVWSQCFREADTKFKQCLSPAEPSRQLIKSCLTAFRTRLNSCLALLPRSQHPSPPSGSKAPRQPSQEPGKINQPGGQMSAPPPAPGSSQAFVKEVFELVNAERKKAGLPAYRLSAILTQAAQSHSEDMLRNGYLSHTDSQGRSASTRIQAAGYSGTAVGENIAKGQPTPRSVVDAWMNSSGHRANILSTRFTEMGVGYAGGSNRTHLWTQTFGAGNTPALF